MEVVSFKPEFQSKEHDLKMSPEMVAAILARYSRKGEGMPAILKQLENTPEEKFEETVWSFLDYGHASIGGLTGTIPVGVDKVSMFTPYFAFMLQPKQDGQETSTRYVEFKPEGLAHPSTMGVPGRFHNDWYNVMLKGFDLNTRITDELNRVGQANPELTRIPEDLPPKTRERMLKNFGLDRARYTLPMAALTNFGLVMTAREWAETLKYAGSFDYPESQSMASEIREQLREIAPRLMKHSEPSDRTQSFTNHFLDRGIEYLLQNGINTEVVSDEIDVDVHVPPRSKYIDANMSLEEAMDKAFEGKKNRYDFAKGLPEKVKLSIKWNNMAIAEARDLNRQRPCQKDTLLAPIGSYMPEVSLELMKKEGKLYDEYRKFLDKRASLMTDLLHSENPRSYMSAMLLGDQTPWEMETNGSHWAYVAELRTSLGVHFRYDQHVRDAHAKIEAELPELTKHIQLGTAAPE